MGVRLRVRSCWASRSESDVVYELEQTRILIGRGRGADVRLPHRTVSVRHATIELDGIRYALVDHETTNGTAVGGARVVPGRKKPLRSGDRIEIGGFAIVFESGIAVSLPTSGERTASLARRLAREALADPDARLDPFLTVLNGPREGEVVPLPVPPDRLVLGRGEDADLVLPDEDASRAHAEVELDLDGATLRDLSSKNGTLLGGLPIQEARLVDRDEFQVGATILRFEDPADAKVVSLESGEDDAGEAPSWEEVAPLPPEPEAPEADATIADDDPSQDAPSAARALSEPKPSRSGVAAADMVIYVLAAAVFAVSALGLIWLLRG